jgi:carbon storage regulator CsrA
MLVLTRKNQEQIRIGDNITISILKVKGNSVRVGIEAPRDIRVIRGELPTFEAMEEFDVEFEQAAPAEANSESGDEETAVSELEWVVMKKLAARKKKACLPVRRCLAEKVARSASQLQVAATH